MGKVPLENREELDRERWELLRQIHRLMEKPLIALSFIWLALLVLDLTAGLSFWLLLLFYLIWAIFAVDFAIRFIIAPAKIGYLRANWLTAVSLLLPTFRVVRVLQIFRSLRMLRLIRTVRSVSFLRLVTSANRGIRSLQSVFGHRGFGFVITVTLLVIVLSATGMRYLESPDALTAAGYQGEVDGGAGFESYGEALWWTATVITTIGPEYWPRTLEGRTLAFLLFVYAFAIFGYITATIASYFVSQDVRRQERRGPTRESEMLQSEGNTEMAVLLQELSLLRSQLASLSGRTVIDELPTTRQDE